MVRFGRHFPDFSETEKKIPTPAQAQCGDGNLCFWI
jgi:hypothetical protein